MKCIKEMITKNYHYDDNEKANVFVEEIQQFLYESENERNIHVSHMINDGWVDSGQIKEDIGTDMKPNYVWFSRLSKHYSIEMD